MPDKINLKNVQILFQNESFISGSETLAVNIFRNAKGCRNALVIFPNALT